MAAAGVVMSSSLTRQTSAMTKRTGWRHARANCRQMWRAGGSHDAAARGGFAGGAATGELVVGGLSLVPDSDDVAAMP